MVRASVVDLLRRREPVSATELAHLLEKHKSTLSPHIQTLLAKGILREAGTVEPGSRGGKPRQMLELNPDCCHVISIDAGPTHLRGSVYDFQGRQSLAREVRHGDLRDPEVFLKDFRDFSADLIKDSTGTPGTCLGIGVGFSGYVDSLHGIVRYAQLVGLRDYPLADDLKNRFGLEVRILNDANAALLGEKWFVLDRQEASHDNVLYFFLESHFFGAGVGILIGNELYEGAQRRAGEVGHQLRHFGIEKALDERLQDRLLDIFSTLILHSFELINPGLVIIGGTLDADDLPFLDTLKVQAETRLRSSFETSLGIEVRASQLQQFPVCAGAAVPFFKDFIASL